MQMKLVPRAAAVSVVVLMIAAATHASERVPPPDADRAPVAIAGEPMHGRVEPIGVLAGHVYAITTLVEGLEAERADTRARCCFLLGQIASPDASDALTDALDDPDRTVRMFAGMALARMGDVRGRAAARAAYEGPRWWMRFWAVEALSRLDRVPQMALEDPDPLVRQLASAGVHGAFGPARAEALYTGPEDAEPGDLIFTMTNYLIGETDWWWHAGHYEQIIRGFETVVWLDPGWLDGLTNAAYLYWSLGRETEAIATYRRAVSMHPDRWESHFELGFYYFNAQKRPADAVEHFARARDLGCPPEKARMYAHALEHSGHPERALEVWRRLLADNPTDGVARQNISRLEEIVSLLRYLRVQLWHGLSGRAESRLPQLWPGAVMSVREGSGCFEA
jgi:tetratricopeptide (TPR) repeat protein